MRHLKVLALLLLFTMLMTGCSSNTNERSKNVSTIKSQPENIETPSKSTDKQSNNSSKDDILVINERIYLTQINDINLNFDIYKDKTIVVEGMFTLGYNQKDDKDIPMVYRRAPGCCGDDGWGGFFLKFKGKLPKDNDWIRVTGKPELVNNGYFDDLYLNVTNIEVLDKRGAEFVDK